MTSFHCSRSNQGCDFISFIVILLRRSTVSIFEIKSLHSKKKKTKRCQLLYFVYVQTIFRNSYNNGFFKMKYEIRSS